MARLQLAVAFLVLISGCSSQSTQPVEGKIVFADGTPAKELAGYTVSFDCEEHKTGASGVVKDDGTFTVGTFEDADGAMPGLHKIALTPPEPELDRPIPPPVIDRKYADLDNSGLTAEITSGSNPVTLTVERATK